MSDDIKSEMEVLQIRHDTKQRAMTEIFNNNMELQSAMQILQKQVTDREASIKEKQTIIDELQKQIVELTASKPTDTMDTPPPIIPPDDETPPPIIPTSGNI
jgi:chromosome segregation ATPase